VSERGFARNALKSRYDVTVIEEDQWHSYTGRCTYQIVTKNLTDLAVGPKRLLNAGCGCHPLTIQGWSEIATDLFSSPLGAHGLSVCATIQQLPFLDRSFGAVVCVGEVLAYCDPAKAIEEFARILVPKGILICDFGNSRSNKYRFTRTFGRAAEIVTDRYNGSPEKIWIYDPRYVKSILTEQKFEICREAGIHVWSPIARRLGLPPAFSLVAERYLAWANAISEGADIMTLVARLQAT
jgi:SAM-dependent methyltransferase